MAVTEKSDERILLLNIEASVELIYIKATRARNINPPARIPSPPKNNVIDEDEGIVDREVF